MLDGTFDIFNRRFGRAEAVGNHVCGYARADESRSRAYSCKQKCTLFHSFQSIKLKFIYTKRVQIPHRQNRIFSISVKITCCTSVLFYRDTTKAADTAKHPRYSKFRSKEGKCKIKVFKVLKVLNGFKQNLTFCQSRRMRRARYSDGDLPERWRKNAEKRLNPSKFRA